MLCWQCDTWVNDRQLNKLYIFKEIRLVYHKKCVEKIKEDMNTDIRVFVLDKLPSGWISFCWWNP